MSDFVDHLELSVRTTNVLKHYGIRTHDEFMALDRASVMKLPHAGARTWREIDEVQQSIGRDDAPTQALALLQQLNALPLRDGYFFVTMHNGRYVHLSKILDPKEW